MTIASSSFAKIHLEIVSIEAELFSGEVSRIFVTGDLGELGIIAGHTPLLTPIKPGHVRILLSEQKEEIFYLSGGILEVQPDWVTILADTAVRAGDLDEAAALEARKRAEKDLSEKRADFDYSSTLAKLSETAAQLQAIQQLKILRKRKRHI